MLVLLVETQRLGCEDGLYKTRLWRWQQTLACECGLNCLGDILHEPATQPSMDLKTNRLTGDLWLLPFRLC